MDYQIEYAKEGDAPGLARINTLSFESRGFLNDVFPGASQAEIEDYKTMHSWKHMTNPQMHLLKVTDPATGQIVGYGRWLLPEALGFAPSLPVLSDRAKEIAKDPTVYAPRPMNQQLYDGFRGMLETSRKKHTTGKDMVLDLLAILPSFQRRGIGSALLRWGTTQADAFGCRIYLEATGEGYPLYFKYGFRKVEEVTLDRGLFGGKGTETFHLMVRDVVPSQESTTVRN